ncbi:SecY interacting protein Syd [Marinobacterium sediminicola]|uniref:SecY interacting protein Syd n=2 Tax=Marinobacterium sediminicola TaxID=518898 RepID=A0ABY1RZ35_9GAMM|nr:SecY-interacting protein Syd [Marinobacterium sediminicola]SMR73525.1 SecY interacting protein Syd [Marinobacterium sediminicola]
MSQLEQLHASNGWPRLPYDSDWPSHCYLQTADNGIAVGWRPVLNTEGTDMFQRLEQALEIGIHPAIVEYFSRYWSDPLPAQLPDGRRICLLQTWNSEDLERLRSNLIGHALSKHKQKRPLTLFFATLEPESDYFLSLDNQDGSIWLERPGKAPEEKLANSMADFLLTLMPLAIDDQT